LVSGTIEELKRKLLGPSEYELHVRGDWPGENFALPAGVTPLEAGHAGPRFRVEDPQFANPVLLRDLIEHGAEVVALQELPRTLEQVYLAAMAQVHHD
jgi:hypothetical protein